MNIFLGILQILLAIHTAIGAVWKFSNSEQTIPALAALPHMVWLGLSVLELPISLCFVIPLFYKPWAKLAPLAAGCIATEMLLFCFVNATSGNINSGQIIYWLVVMLLCDIVVFGRLVRKPRD